MPAPRRPYFANPAQSCPIGHGRYSFIPAIALDILNIRRRVGHCPREAALKFLLGVSELAIAHAISCGAKPASPRIRLITAP